VVAPDGHLMLTGFGLTQLFFEPLTPFPPEQFLSEPFTAQTDLYAVGLLLRRLAFASGLKSGGSGGRDPLLKVLARATFPDPATRFQDAAEMAEALRQAGRTTGRAEVPARAVRGPVRVSPQAIATLPSRSGPAQEPTEDEDRRFALLLVAAAFLLMLTVIAAGWFLIDRSDLADPFSAPAGTSSNRPDRPADS